MRTNMTRKLLSVLLLVCMLLALPAGALAAPLPEGEGETRTVQVATVDELLKAIAPDTVIELTGTTYDLTTARGYGIYGSRYYTWNDTYDDGWELEIDNVEGLTIRAVNTEAEIVTAPRYACVLKFVGCRDITLEGFTAGHIDGPGYCAGAVLHFANCRGVQVERCDLYGCGTYGLEVYGSNSLYAHDTVIRDCSYGAVSADGSAGILLDECDIRDIDGIAGMFMFTNCRDSALINSTVKHCGGGSLFEFYSTKGFLMDGCTVSDNSFSGMFFSTLYNIVVTGCAFEHNRLVDGWYLSAWMPSEQVVDQNGEAYSEWQLSEMERHESAGWTAPEEPAFTTVAPEASEDGMVHVHTVDELLAAIAPDTVIYLEDGVYDLSKATAYGYENRDYWYWMSCFDGPGLAIRNVENLTITAGGPHRARIVAEPRYCEVLSFENCRGLKLENFTAGHTQRLEDNGCAGGVLSLMDCRDFRIEDCSLYGCGILGVSLFNCLDGEITHTEIHDCTSGAFSFYNSRDVAITACNIHDIPGFVYALYDCRHISADGEVLPEGTIW